MTANPANFDRVTIPHPGLTSDDYCRTEHDGEYLLSIRQYESDGSYKGGLYRYRGILLSSVKSPDGILMSPIPEHEASRLFSPDAPCPRCHGKGWRKDLPDEPDCAACNGSGLHADWIDYSLSPEIRLA